MQTRLRAVLICCILALFAVGFTACGDDDDDGGGGGGGGGIEVIGNEGIDKGAPNYRSLVQRMSQEQVDCFIYSGITANNAVQLFKDVAAGLPDAKLFGPDGVAEAAFADPEEGGVPADVAGRTLVTVATLSPDQYPEAGQQFFEDYTAKYGEDNPDPYAIYGFESMSLALDAIERAAEESGAEGGEIDREAVIDALFNTENRESVIGTYSIDDNGDTTITDYGAYEITDGELSFRETIKAKSPTPPKSGGPAGGDKPPVGNSTAQGDELTIYSSLPLQGTSRGQSEAVIEGIRLALETRNNEAGPFKIKYESLDDATAQAGQWDPGQTGSNARKVVADDSAVFYIGEFNSGASAISIPILNKAGIPQVSPANTAVGLTSDEPGADEGEPGKYYSNKRHYARVAPKDTIQGAALATLAQQEGCTKVFIANDKEVYGAGLATNIEQAIGNL